MRRPPPGASRASDPYLSRVTASQIQVVAVAAVILCLVASTCAALAGVQLGEVTSRLGRVCTGAYAVSITGLTVCYPFLQRTLVTKRPARGWIAAACICTVIVLASEALVASPFFAGVLVTCALLIAQTRVMATLLGGATGLAEFILLLVRPYSPVAKLLSVGLDLVTIVVLLTLALLARTLIQLQISRERLARLSVDQERSRISRDLHDILGRTLVAVSLRQEAALNLLNHDVELARRQLVASGETIREGQAQLRALTHGPMTAGIEEELQAARALCERIGIRLEARADMVEGNMGAECALVIREGITNMLKHADASTCWVEVHAENGRVITTVINDGCPDRPMNHDGSGLDRMRRRIASMGGSLEAGPAGNGKFRLTATISMDEAQ